MNKKSIFFNENFNFWLIDTLKGSVINRNEEIFIENSCHFKDKLSMIRLIFRNLYPTIRCQLADFNSFPSYSTLSLNDNCQQLTNHHKRVKYIR